jgi:uncharacterized protein DUF3592
MATRTNGTVVRSFQGTGYIIVVVLWSGFTLTLDVPWGCTVVWQIQVLGYPTVVGRVTQSDIEAFHGSRNTAYSPKIKYAYRVNGNEYTGDRYRYGQMSGNEGSARRIVAEYPVGRQIDVFYSVTEPSDSVLLAGLEGADLFIPLFMTPFNMVMIFLWFAPVSKSRRESSRLGAAIVKDDGFETRVRLTDLGPVACGAAVGGGLWLAAILIVGCGFGYNPPLPIAYAAWGTFLVGGACAYCWQWWRIARGQFDLVIDDRGRRWTLPRTRARGDSVVIDAAQIASIDVVKSTKQSSKGNTYHLYSPTFVFAGADGVVRRETLVEWSDESRAKALAHWLRKRLASIR